MTEMNYAPNRLLTSAQRVVLMSGLVLLAIGTWLLVGLLINVVAGWVMPDGDHLIYRTVDIGDGRALNLGVFIPMAVWTVVLLAGLVNALLRAWRGRGFRVALNGLWWLG
jgi:hypothetical protein